MNRTLIACIVGVVCIAGCLFGWRASAQSDSATASPHLVVSQFQSGGATPTDEFIEIKNTSGTAVDLAGYIVVYRSAGGTDDGSPMASWASPTMLQPGQFYLIAAAGSYDGSVPAD